MTSEQHQAAARKVIDAVKNNTNGAYDQWTKKDHGLENPDAQARFVQQHAGLSETPSHDDVKAISRHINTSMKDDVAEIQAKNPGEHVVGSWCGSD